MSKKFLSYVGMGIGLKLGFHICDEIIRPIANEAIESIVYQVIKKSNHGLDSVINGRYVPQTVKSSIDELIVKKDIKNGLARKSTKFVFKTKKAAEETLVRLTELMDANGKISVKQAAELCSNPKINLEDAHLYGWCPGELDDREIVKEGDKWVINMPVAYRFDAR